MHDILLFESDLGTSDTSNLELFFTVPLHCHVTVLFLKRCMADVVEKGQSSNGVGKLLIAVYLENSLFKDKFIHSFLELDLKTCEHIKA